MNELTIPLDVHRKMPLYEQIYRYICREIKDGRMRAGEKLPSSRALALFYLRRRRSESPGAALRWYYSGTAI